MPQWYDRDRVKQEKNEVALNYCINVEKRNGTSCGVKRVKAVDTAVIFSNRFITYRYYDLTEH